MTLDLLAWALLASYVIHLLDETLMNGGFVHWVSTRFWPAYDDQMFFWFNLGAILGITASNLLFDIFGGHFVVLPLFWISGFAVHGVTVHVLWTVRQRDYSPGLVTSILYWIVAYLTVRYGFGAGLISAADFWVGTVAGALLLAGFLTLAPTVIFPALARSSSSRSA
jgi:Protein of unknown function with HXXEE motif